MGGVAGTVAHEFIHTLGVEDNGYAKGGILNSPPEGLNKDEIKLITDESLKAKQ